MIPLLTIKKKKQARFGILQNSYLGKFGKYYTYTRITQ